MDRIYRPDKWVIIYVKEANFYKVLAEWGGSYLEGRSWRLSSPIVKIEETQGSIISIYNESGSEYICDKNMYRLGLETAGVYNQINNECEIVNLEEYLTKFN